MKLAVLIVNYETPELVESLVKQFSAFDQSLFDLYIIDNSSVEGRSPYATQVNEENVGFDQAAAAWLQEMRAKDYLGYWLLNTDCDLDVTKNYVLNYLLLLQHDPTIGIISSKILSSHPWHTPQYDAEVGRVSSVGYIDFQSAVISKELLNKFSFEGTDYFFGGLDFDFTMKAHDEGMQLLVDGRTSIAHKGSVSLHRTSNEENVKKHCAKFGCEFIPNSPDATNMGIIYNSLSKRYPRIIDPTFNRMIEEKQKYFTEVMTDYGVFNFNIGLSIWNTGDMVGSIPYFKRAAICEVNDAFLYVVSAYESIMDYTEATAFLTILLAYNNNIIGSYNYVAAQRDTYNAPAKAKQRFVFYIPPDAGNPWDAAHTETGIGGSEIAAIKLSEALAKTGQEVLVFNNCAVEGVYNNVTWLHKDKFNEYEKNNLIDVLLVSRWPEFRFVNPKTKVYFWAHDLSYYERINSTNWQYFDKFLMLSKYQYKFFSESYPFIPSSAYAMMINGVDLSRFEQDVVRNPKKLIYSSNPDRGLNILFDIFEELYKWDNQLELHVFGYYPEDFRKHPKYWRDMPGVIYRGYTAQYELAAEYMSSKLWLYPNTWLETFCITAIEAQAAGTPTVASDWGCLRERVANAGILIPGTTKDARHKTEFIEAIKLLLTDEVEWKKYSDAGKRQVKEYTWDKAAATLLEISHANNKRK